MLLDSKIYRHFGFNNGLGRQLLASLSFAVLLSACGSSNDGESTPSSTANNASSSSSGTSQLNPSPGVIEKDAASIGVHFPPAFTQTESSTIMVRGKAADAAEISQITVAGVQASPLASEASDGLWQAEITLADGNNAIEVVLNQNGNVSTIASLTVQKIAPFFSPSESVVVDENHLMVYEQLESSYQLVNINDGSRSEFFNARERGDDIPSFPVDMIVHEGHLYVLDFLLDAVVKFNLATKERSLLAQNPGNNDDQPFALRSPGAMALDTSGDSARLIIADCIGYSTLENKPLTCGAFENTEMAMFAVDLASGERTVLFEDSYSEAIVPLIPSVNDIALTADASTVYIAGAFLGVTNDGIQATPPAIFSLNLADGSRTIINSAASEGENDEVNFGTASNLILSDDENTLYVLDAVGDVELGTGIFSINLADNSRKIFSYFVADDPDTEDSSNETLAFRRPVYMSDNSNTIFVSDRGRKAIIAVNKSDAKRSPVSAQTSLSEDDSLNLFKPVDVTIAPAAEMLFVTDEALATVFSIDLESGEKTIVNGGKSDGEEPRLNSPKSIVTSDAGDKVFVSGGYNVIINNIFTGPQVQFLPHVYSIEMTEGKRELLNPEPSFEMGNVMGMVMDEANNRVLLTSSIQNSRPFINQPVKDLGYVLAIDLDSGEQSALFSNFDFDWQPYNLRRPAALTLDNTNGNNRLIIIDPSQDGLLTFDLDSNTLALVSNNATPNGDAPRLSLTRDVAVDPTQANTALVTDSSVDALIKVDLSTGERNTFSAVDENNPDNPYRQARGMSVDDLKFVAYVVDDFYKTVVVVDLITGKRVYLQ